MKVAVSIPDPIFSQAERLATRLKVSRSKVYARALREFVANHDTDAVTASIDAAIAAAGDEPDRFIRRAARNAAKHSDW